MRDQDHDDPRLNDDDVEAALAALEPAAARIDPVAAAFDAGRRAGRRGTRLWQSAAAAMLVAGVATLVQLRDDTRPAPHPTTLVRAARPAPLPEQSLLRMQQAVWARGVDGLPAAHVPAAGAISSADMF